MLAPIVTGCFHRQSAGETVRIGTGGVNPASLGRWEFARGKFGVYFYLIETHTHKGYSEAVRYGLSRNLTFMT